MDPPIRSFFPTSELGWAPGKRLLDAEVTDEEPASDGVVAAAEDGAWADEAAAARMMDVDASFGGFGVP